MQEVGVIIQPVGKSVDIIRICYIKEHIAVEELRLKAAVYAYISLYAVAKSGILGTAAALAQTELAVFIGDFAAYFSCDNAVKTSESLRAKLEIRTAVAGDRW